VEPFFSGKNKFFNRRGFTGPHKQEFRPVFLNPVHETRIPFIFFEFGITSTDNLNTTYE
jgi:hypothetical protein